MNIKEKFNKVYNLLPHNVSDSFTFTICDNLSDLLNNYYRDVVYNVSVKRFEAIDYRDDFTECYIKAPNVDEYIKELAPNVIDEINDYLQEDLRKNIQLDFERLNRDYCMIVRSTFTQKDFNECLEEVKDSIVNCSWWLDTFNNVVSSCINIEKLKELNIENTLDNLIRCLENNELGVTYQQLLRELELAVVVICFYIETKKYEIENLIIDGSDIDISVNFDFEPIPVEHIENFDTTQLEPNFYYIDSKGYLHYTDKKECFSTTDGLERAGYTAIKFKDLDNTLKQEVIKNKLFMQSINEM